MMGVLIRAVIFGIGVEIGRDIYRKIKGKEPEPAPAPGEPRADPEAASPDEGAPGDEPEAQG